MRCTFVAMGAENISIEVLSALLKQHGHETALGYDQSLFDDKNYLFKPRLARLFDHRDVVVNQVVESRPDLVALSVMTPTYKWALDIARRIKQVIDVPIIFGGIHPTTVPEKVLGNDCIDMICVGEGDQAMVELCDAIEAGREDLTIRNIWFKKDGAIIQNDKRPLIANLDELPFPDKELFAPHIPIGNSYLAVTARGCPYACTFCALSWYAEEAKQLGAKRLRERSVAHVIAELKQSLAKYDYKWIEFRNNTFTANKRWVLEFCREYKKEIGRPFLAFGHPQTVTDEIAVALKDAGCFAIQLGVESFSEWVRANILNRHETNVHVMTAVEAMDKAGLQYSLDYILGLPKQEEQELLEAADFFIGRKMCYRVSPYMLAYLPKLEIVKLGLEHGEITEADVEALERGEHDHYLSAGSVGQNREKLRFFKAYRIFFRLIPLLGPRVSRWMLDRRVHRLFRYLPMDRILDVVDIGQALRKTDLLAKTYAKNYWWWFSKRFDRGHPAYWRNSIKNNPAYRTRLDSRPARRQTGAASDPKKRAA